MKTFTLATLAALAQGIAVEGDDCYYQDTCNPDVSGLWCSEWYDTQYGEMKTCEDCNTEYRTIADSYSVLVEYTCPPESQP